MERAETPHFGALLASIAVLYVLVATYLLLALLLSASHQLVAAIDGGEYLHGVDRVNDASAFLHSARSR